MVVGVMRRAASTAEGDMQCGEKRAVSARRILGSVVVIHATFPTLRSRPDYVDASLSSARSGAVHRSPPGRRAWSVVGPSVAVIASRLPLLRFAHPGAGRRSVCVRIH